MQGERLTLDALDPSLLGRFRADLERLTQAAPSAASPLGVAVSGGADSVALLLLAHAAYPGRVRAATVDHGLRPAAVAECAYVATQCGKLGVPHAILHLDAGEEVTATNLQERARLMRYRCLGRWAAAHAIPFIATAHQRDDVAETFLMRAVRGAGGPGLAAMRAARRNDGPGYRSTIVRPLLTWSRAELAAVAAAGGIVPVADPSNTDPRFDRARVRALLAERPDLPADRLARAAANLRDVDDAIEWVVRRELATRWQGQLPDEVRLDTEGLPFEIKRRLTVLAIDELRRSNGLSGPWRGTGASELARALERGAGGTLADIRARFVKGLWHFTMAPPRRD